MKIVKGSYLMNKCDYQHRTQMTVSCLGRFDISLKFSSFKIIELVQVFSFSQFKLTWRLCCHNSRQLSRFHRKTLDSHCSHLSLRFSLLFVTTPKLFRHCCTRFATKKARKKIINELLQCLGWCLFSSNNIKMLPSSYLFLWSIVFDTHSAVKASSSKHNSRFLQLRGWHKSPEKFQFARLICILAKRS